MHKHYVNTNTETRKQNNQATLIPEHLDVLDEREDVAAEEADCAAEHVDHDLRRCCGGCIVLARRYAYPKPQNKPG